MTIIKDVFSGVGFVCGVMAVLFMSAVIVMLPITWAMNLISWLTGG